MMKISHTIIAAVVLCVLLDAAHVQRAMAAELSFTRTLRIGVSGEDVRQLQEVLNNDLTTRIANAGPGSPGQETGYFGQLTKDAVTRFQDKYQQEILMPNSLSAGTGIVGPSTAAVLSGLETAPGSSVGAVVSTTSSAFLPTDSVAVGNPNLVNLDKFLATIDKVSAKQGMSPQTVAIIKDQVMKEIATTTDLKHEFIGLVGKKAISSDQPDSLFAVILTNITAVLGKIFTPEQASAFTGVPFGGSLVYALPCTCSATWWTTISPLPPSYVASLAYVPFSQAFLSYNIPATPWLLGTYSPSTPLCYMGVAPYCYPAPVEGVITPKVGSASL
ncbi:MAG: peptidoglycan-binding domain-containing protein [Minisyncoccia bacterium]